MPFYQCIQRYKASSLHLIPLGSSDAQANPALRRKPLINFIIPILINLNLNLSLNLNFCSFEFFYLQVTTTKDIRSIIIRVDIHSP